jgi:hypothetical protein
MYMLMYSSVIGVISLAIAVCLNRSSRTRAARIAAKEYGGQFQEGQIEELLEDIKVDNQRRNSAGKPSKTEERMFNNNAKIKEAIKSNRKNSRKLSAEESIEVPKFALSSDSSISMDKKRKQSVDKS